MELIAILLLVIIALLLIALKKLLEKLTEISVKIAKHPYPTHRDEEGHIETARPIGDNLENLRDDIGTIAENLYRVMGKYGIETWHPPMGDTMAETEEKRKKGKNE